MERAIPAVIFVAACVGVLLIPALLRALRPESPLVGLLESVGAVLLMPARLLSVLHNGDVRMAVYWMVGGLLVLVLIVMNVAR